MYLALSKTSSQKFRDISQNFISFFYTKFREIKNNFAKYEINISSTTLLSGQVCHPKLRQLTQVGKLTEGGRTEAEFLVYRRYDTVLKIVPIRQKETTLEQKRP
jgi:hypothetical protein